MAKLLNIAVISVFRALAAGLCLSGGAHAAELLDVRFGPGQDVTRVVFDLDGAAGYSISGDETGAGRILVDFSSLTVNSADRGFQPGKGHIRRYGFTGAGTSGVRAVLELKTTAKIKAAFMLAPAGEVTKHRLVIDLQTADKTAFLASLPQPYPDLAAVIEKATAEPAPVLVAPPRSTQKEVSAPQPERRVIVIDAGHGGVDPGAQGQSGTHEKTVTLAAATALAEILKERGRYDVFLTREDDSTMRPDAREALARKAGAELFISLHADAIAQTAVRGASVYTLSEKGTARSATLAKSQNELEVYNLDLEEFDTVVGGMLFDKAQDTTTTASSRFAEMLIAELSRKTPMLSRSHRRDNLRVLLAPDVPAVLLEMAFISNANDEANLNSPAWRSRTMTAVADSIDQYFDDSELKRHAVNSAGGAQ